MDTTDTRHLNPAGYPQEIKLDFSAYPFEVLYNSVKMMKTVPWVIWCSRKILGFKELDIDHYDVEFNFTGSQIDYVREHDYVNCWVNYAPFQIRWAGKMPKLDFDWWSYYIRNVERQANWDFVPSELVDQKWFKISTKYSGKHLLPRRRLYCSQGYSANDLPIINISLPLTQSVLQKSAGTRVGAILDMKRVRTTLKKTSNLEKQAKTVDQIIAGLNALVSGRSGKCLATRTKILPKFRRWVYHVRCSEKWSNPAGWTVTIKAVPKDDRFTDVRKMDLFVACTCPSWVYHGPDYFALTQDYLDGKPKGLATTPDFARFPWKKNWKVCKHARLIFKLLKQMPNLPPERLRKEKYPKPEEEAPQKRPGLPGAPEPVEEEQKPPEAPKRPVEPVPEEKPPEKRHIGPPAAPVEPEIEEPEVEEEPEEKKPAQRPGLQPGLRTKPEEPEEEVPEEEPTKETPQVKKLREPFQRGLQRQKEREEEAPPEEVAPPKRKPLTPKPKPKKEVPVKEEEEGEEEV